MLNNLQLWRTLCLESENHYRWMGRMSHRVDTEKPAIILFFRLLKLSTWFMRMLDVWLVNNKMIAMAFLTHFDPGMGRQSLLNWGWGLRGLGLVPKSVFPIEGDELYVESLISNTKDFLSAIGGTVIVWWGECHRVNAMNLLRSSPACLLTMAVFLRLPKSLLIRCFVFWEPEVFPTMLCRRCSQDNALHDEKFALSFYKCFNNSGSIRHQCFQLSLLRNFTVRSRDELVLQLWAYRFRSTVRWLMFKLLFAILDMKTSIYSHNMTCLQCAK